MKEQVYTATNGVKVKYKHKPSKYDYNHIIFVFSGFNNPLPGKRWDFINAMTDCPCDVIWISDDFEGMHTYYLCIDMDFKVEEAIKEFIGFQTHSKELDFDHITLTGFSKGATAALYYGLKLNISNLVLTIPQVSIGSNVDLSWQDTAKHMMGKNYTNMHMKYLDNLIPNLLKKDSKFDRNIYLLTSEEDVQYKVHIEPILPDLEKYSNFNLLKSHSLLVRQHRDVTVHHTPLLLSIYYALASEAIPRYSKGKVNFFGNQSLATNNLSLRPFVDLKSFSVKEKVIYIEGVGIIRDWHTDKWSDISYELIIEGEKTYYKNLAVGHRPALTRQYYKNRAVVYDKSWFTTEGYKGIDISDIPMGTYNLYIKMSIEGTEKTCKLTSLDNIQCDNEKISFVSNDLENYLTIK